MGFVKKAKAVKRKVQKFSDKVVDSLDSVNKFNKDFFGSDLQKNLFDVDLFGSPEKKRGKRQ